MLNENCILFDDLRVLYKILFRKNKIHIQILKMLTQKIIYFSINLIYMFTISEFNTKYS